MAKIFGDFLLRGGGVPPNSAELFLAKWISVRGLGRGEGGTLLTEKIRWVVFEGLP